MKRVLFFFFMLYSGFCFSATYTVSSDSEAEFAVGTLRGSLHQAEANPGPDTIVFDRDMTISLTNISRVFVYNNEGVTIDAQGYNVIIDGTGMNLDPGWPAVGIWLVDTGHLWGGGQLGGNATIRGITFRNCAYGGALVSSGSANNSFIDCTFHNNGASGIVVDGTDASLDGSQNTSNITIQNCVFYNQAHSGVYIKRTEDVSIENCVSYNNTQNGFLIAESSNVDISNCRTYSNTQSGIWFISDCHNNSVTGCEIGGSAGGNGWPGVIISGTCTDNTLRNNSITHNGAEGIKIDDHCETTTIENNVIAENIYSGILVTGSSGSSTIINNTLLGNQQNGIWLMGASNNRIHNNTIGTNSSGAVYGNRWCGVLVSSGSTDNFIGGDTASLGNLIVNNLAEGVKVDGWDTIRNLVRFNTYYSNAQGGYRNVNGANQALPVPYIYPPATYTSPQQVTVHGLGTPGTVVDIYISDSQTDKTQARYYKGTVEPNADGEFSFTFDYDHPGQIITAVARDGVRNSSGFDVQITEGGLTGTVLDSKTKMPVYDAEVYLYDSQNRIYTATRTGTDGKFTFALLQGTFSIVVKKQGYRFPSILTESLSGAAKGEVFSFQSSLNLEIPVDQGYPLDVNLTLEKDKVSAGDPLGVQLAINNTSTDDYSKVNLRYYLPPTLKLASSAPVQVNGETVSLQTETDGFILPLSNIRAGDNFTIPLVFWVSGGAEEKEFMIGARAYQVRGGSALYLSDLRLKEVAVVPDEFMENSTLIGKVFLDSNANGIQDYGEKGIPNAVIYSEQGLIITTDKNGLYSVPDITEGSHVFMVKRNSLPKGMTLEKNSMMVHVRKGSMHKVNFAVKAESADISVDTPASTIILQEEMNPPVAFTEVNLRKYENQGFRKTGEDQYQMEFDIVSNSRLYIKDWDFVLRTVSDQREVFVKSSQQISMLPKQFIVPLNGRQLYELNGKNLEYFLTITYSNGVKTETPAQKIRIEHKGSGIIPGLLQFEARNPLKLKTTPNLPKQGAISVSGYTRADSSLIVSCVSHEEILFEQLIDSDSKGHFEHSFLVPFGEYEIRLTNENEKAPFYQKSITLSSSQLILVAMAEEEIGKLSSTGNIEVAGNSDKFDEELYNEGKAAFYLKGKVKGKYLLTLSYDSERGKTQDDELFNYLDPDKYYPIYGDSSQTDYDATDSDGKLFLMVEWDRSKAQWGNFQTRLNDESLLFYNRSLYGGKVEYTSLSSTKFGDPDMQVILFGSSSLSRQGFNTIESTGGSLYYLSRSDIVKGSEQVFLEVRDTVTGEVVEKIDQIRSVNYEMDYDSGRIVFTSPVPRTMRTSRVTDTSLNFRNQVYIVVTYEYKPDSPIEDANAGLRVEKAIGDHVSVGTTLITEDNGSNDNAELKSVDVTSHITENTKIRMEAAATDQYNPRTLSSQNGGLSFSQNSLGRADDSGHAYSVVVSNQKDQKRDLSVYYTKRESGFINERDYNEAGTEKTGANAQVRVSEKVKLFSELFHETTDDETQIAKGYKKKLEGRAGVAWQALEKLRLETEYHGIKKEVPDDTINLWGLAGYYDFSQKMSAFLKQQVSGAEDDMTATQGGLEYQVTERLRLGLSHTVGEEGDYSQVNALWAVDKTREFYMEAQSDGLNQGSGNDTELVVGMNDVLNRYSSMYTEYKIRSSGDYSYTTIGSGYRHKISDLTQMYINYENETRDDDRDSNVLGGGISYCKPDKAYLSTGVEVRRDETTDEIEQWLTQNKAKWTFDCGLSLFGKVNYSQTDNETLDIRQADYKEYATGIAYRPVLLDVVNFLFKYTRLTDQNPAEREEPEWLSEHKTDVYSGEFLWDICKCVQYFFKYAWKQSDYEYTFSEEEFESEISLWINRINVYITQNIGTALEYRVKDYQTLDEKKEGYAAELFYDPVENFRVTVGYNFTDFSDNMQSFNDYENYGPYIRFTGKAAFDELEMLSPFKKEYYNWRLFKSMPEDFKISGKLDLAFGFVDRDFEWNLSNMDLWEKNWRYLYGEDKENTYNPGMYSQLRVNTEYPLSDEWALYFDFSIDPHMVASKSDTVHVTSESGDSAEVTFYYWASNDKTISRSVRTKNGNAFNTGEQNVHDNTIDSYQIETSWGDTFTIPETKLDEQIVPWKTLALGYKSDENYFKLNVLGDMTATYSSDDPLRLVGNRDFWQPHSWLYFWQPGQYYYGTQAFGKGRLDDSLIFYNRNSFAQWLTYVRGAQFATNVEGLGRFEGAVATPITQWDLYDGYTDVNNVSGAFRYKSALDAEAPVQIGSTYAFRAGYNDEELDFMNQVFAGDCYFTLWNDYKVTMEYAVSSTETDKTSDIYAEKYIGQAFKLNVERKVDFASFEHTLSLDASGMTKDFMSAGSDYRFTSLDQFWSNHLDFYDHPQWFKDEVLPCRLGNGLRENRNVYKAACISQNSDKVTNLLQFMYVESNEEQEFQERRLREELTVPVEDLFTLQFMVLNNHYPETEAGIEPLANQTDVAKYLSPNADERDILNNSILAGEDPSIGAYSTGIKVPLFGKKIELVGVYEYTNNYGDQFPQFIMQDTSYGNLVSNDDGRFDSPVTFLDSQQIFDLPSYDYYNIYRMKLFFYPWEPVTLQVAYTKNENKFASGIDDNINHLFFEAKYQDPDKKYQTRMNYTRSKMMNVPDYMETGDLEYESHDNFFTEFAYFFSKDSKMYVHYGIFAGMTDYTSTPYLVSPWSLPTLDTRNIVRVTYSKKF